MHHTLCQHSGNKMTTSRMPCQSNLPVRLFGDLSDCGGDLLGNYCDTDVWTKVISRHGNSPIATQSALRQVRPALIVEGAPITTMHKDQSALNIPVWKKHIKALAF